MKKTTNMCRKDTRWQLLTTVSSLALLASAYGAGGALAAGKDGDQPLLWVEWGGQLNELSNPQEMFTPPFMASVTQPSLLSALNVQRPPAYGIDEEGKLSFQPEGSNWVFSASIRYGRSQAARHKHQQTANAYVPKYFKVPAYNLTIGTPNFAYYPNGHVKFADGMAKQSENHTILDFQAGKDVGLGVFGTGGSSIISAGVRFAQFSSRANVSLQVQPDIQYRTAPISSLPGFIEWLNPHIHFHDYIASADMARNFRGAGPTLSWNASASVAGDENSGEITLDWGLNGAVLFGRQTVSGHQKTTVKSYYLTRLGVGNGSRNDHFIGPCQPYNDFGGQINNYATAACAIQTANTPINRSRNVVVPDLGGFAGLSFRYVDAKISVGYRADFFFGAIDGGIDTRKSEDRGFYGPFASISIGLGD